MTERDPVEVYSYCTDTHTWKSGSGYPLASRLILTAAHVVCSNEQPLAAIKVRESDSILRGGTVAWYDASTDLALIEIVDPDWKDQQWAQPVRWGRLVTQQSIPACTVRGFPAVLASPNLRDRHDATGRINPGSRTKSGEFSLDIDYPPEPSDESGSRWAGMSGAAILVSGLIIGVAVKDPPGFASRQLVGSRIVRPLADPEFCTLVARHCGHQPIAEAVELDGISAKPTRPSSPASLLRADVAQTRFRQRPELELLISWCHSDILLSIRLVHGPAGQGKTRLGHQLIQRMLAEGWASVMLSDYATREEIMVLAHVRVPTLVVVDYAEARSSQLVDVFDALNRADAKTRLLLLTRSAGAWRTDRIGNSLLLDELADDRILIALTPLEATLQGRHEAWTDALGPLASTLSSVLPGDWPRVAAKLMPPKLTGKDYQTILAIQMNVLASLLDAAEPLPERPLVENEVVRLHEVRHWRRLAATFNISLDSARLEALITVATLWGARTKPDAERLITAAIPEITENECFRAAEWIHTLYGSDVSYWVGLQPDQLAEHHISTVLQPQTKFPNLAAATARVVSPQQTERGIAVLGRVAARHATLASTIGAVLIAGGEETAIIAFMVATRISRPDVLLQELDVFISCADVATLTRLNRLLPANSLILDTIGVRVAETLVRILRDRFDFDRTTYLADFAEAVNFLGVRLGLAGKVAESLMAAQEAVELARELAVVEPANLSNLATTISHFAAALSSSGRRAESLAAIQEAIDLYRVILDEKSDPLDRIGLAGSLDNLAGILRETNRPRDAINAARESVNLRRQIVARSRDAVEFELSELKEGLRRQLSSVDQQGGAWATARADVYSAPISIEVLQVRLLADLAYSISLLSTALADADQLSEALAPARESVAYYRGLIAFNRDEHLPGLAHSLSTLGQILGDLGQLPEALSVTEEAVDLGRELVASNRNRWLPFRAMTLHNHSIRLSDVGRLEDGLVASQNAVELRRELVALNRDEHLSSLANSIKSLAIDFATAGQRSEGIAAAQEAVELWTELIDREPDHFNPDMLAEAKTLLYVLRSKLLYKALRFYMRTSNRKSVRR
ncbi:MAG: tetratricopeptide repeat protein [Actinobacteria bacterium]|nr:tetratricopeptide repeat protein [Actinomycetota bacterium]